MSGDWVTEAESNALPPGQIDVDDTPMVAVGMVTADTEIAFEITVPQLLVMLTI